MLDFVNQAEHIQEAFKFYYEATVLSEGTDHNLLYDHERKLSDFQFYTQDEVDNFVSALYSEKYGQERLPALLDPVVDRFKAAREDEQARLP